MAEARQGTAKQEPKEIGNNYVKKPREEPTPAELAAMKLRISRGVFGSEAMAVHSSKTHL